MGLKAASRPDLFWISTGYSKLMDANQILVPILVGPTAVGKTAVAVALARRLDAAIISADSRQVYKRMDIGTAKPDRQTLTEIPHHLIDFLEIPEAYSAGRWGEAARKIIDERITAGRQPLVVGGSGFYIRALVDGFFEEPPHDKREALKLREELDKMRLSTLRRQLKEADPVSAERIPGNDRQRTTRALEVFTLTGRRLSDLQDQMTAADQLSFKPVFFGLDMPRDLLYERINKRVERMILTGLIEEVEHLISDDYDPECNALQTVGYQEVFPYLQGRLGLYEIMQLIQKNTRHYAKRQLTWFRNDARIQWLDATAPVDALADEICHRIGVANFSLPVN